MAGGSGPVRARLRRDTYLIPTDDGARILTNDGAESLSGATIHRWIDRLGPYLTGASTVDELVSPLPADKREMVERIITLLHDRRLVRDGGESGPRPGEVGYLDSFVPSADLSYRDYRAATVVAVGSGPILDEVVGALARSGVGRVVAAGEDSLRAGVDLAVHVSGPSRALAVDRTCGQLGIPLVQGIHLHDEFWICVADWESGWHRLNRWQEHRPEDRLDVLSPDSVAVAAGMLGMAAFRTLTGTIQPAETSSMLCLHLPTLRTTTHRFLAWRTERMSFVDRMATLRSGAALDREELDAAGTALLDPRLGVLGEVAERDYTQLPLNMAAATVAGWSRPVIGAGLTVQEARWRAILRGVAGFAVSAVNPGGQVRAARLADGSTRMLPAAEVFVAPDEDPAGVAAGYTWAEAVSAGLLDACARLPASHTGPPRRIDPHAAGPDAEALAYLRMIDILGVPLGVYDVTGHLKVPTLAFGTGERTVAVVSAPRAADALPAGLRAVVLDEQARRTGRPECAPSAVPRLDLAGAPDAEPPAPCTEGDLIAALLAAGHDPLVVPLDHDPEVHRIVPYIARVVMADA